MGIRLRSRLGLLALGMVLMFVVAVPAIAEHPKGGCPPPAGDAVEWVPGSLPDRNNDGLVCVIPKGPSEERVAAIVDNQVADLGGLP